MPLPAARARKVKRARPVSARRSTARSDEAKAKRLNAENTSRAIALAERQDEKKGSRHGSRYVSGLEINLQKIDEEYVSALQDLGAKIGVYQQMGNEAKIQAQLRANILPILSSARAKVVGGTQEMRDLISQNILREGDPRYWCDTSWNQRLLEKLTALHYGFALHGKSWGVVDGYRVITSKTYLHPKSLGGPLGAWEWSPDGSTLVAVHRAYSRPDGSREIDERIRIEDIDAAVWWHTGENWEGVSLIRSMYGAWVKKDLASKIAMIALLNGGVGIPMATLGPNDGKTDRDALTAIAKDSRGGNKERQFIVLANGQKMEFLTTQGQIVDARPVIDAQNMDMASAGATDFMQAGQTSSGSRAGGSVMMVAHMQQVNATLRWLQDNINHGSGYLRGDVEDLIYANFENVRECPHIDLSQVSPADQIDNLTLLGDLTQKGVVPRSLKIANAALDRLGYPLMTQAEWDAAEESAQKKAANSGGAGRPDNATETDRNEPRNDKAGRAFGLTDTAAEKKSPGGGIRPMKSPESWPWLISTER